MATRVTSNPFSDPAFGGSILRIGSALFGGADEENRFRNLAYAESARARIGVDNERAAMARRQREAREQLSAGLAPRPDGTTPSFGDVVANLPQHLVWLDNSEVGGTRAGVGLALSNGQPRQQALALGGMGGDAGNTVFGVETASGDRRYAADRSAGATVEAARIGQAGANWRFLRGDANPGADGVVLGPDRARALGFGDEVTAPTFVPGAANIPPGNVRVSPASGPMNPEAPAITRTEGLPQRATGTNPALDFYQQRLLEWERGGRQGPPPPLPEGATASDVVFGPSYATQGRRNEGAAEVAGIRAGATANRPLPATAAADLRTEVTTQLQAAVPGGANVPEIVSWVEQRATDYVRQGMATGMAVEQAIADAQRDAGLTPRTGRIFGDPARINPGVPARIGGSAAPAAPADTGAPMRIPPAPAAPAAAAPIPPRPPNLPPGSAYSPSRQMWRAPDGRLFTADGRPAA